MQTTNIAAIVSALASSTLTVSFEGRDGEDKFVVGFPVKDLIPLLTDEVLKPIIENACRTLVFRTSKIGLLPLPHVNTAADFVAAVSAASGEGRFKVSKEDVAKATQLLKDLENLGKTDLWAKKHGVECTLDNVTNTVFEARVAKVKAEKEREEAERRAMLADLE